MPEVAKVEPLTLLSLSPCPRIREQWLELPPARARARQTWRRVQEEEHELLCCSFALRARVGLVPLWTEVMDAGPSSLDAHAHTQTAH